MNIQVPSNPLNQKTLAQIVNILAKKREQIILTIKNFFSIFFLLVIILSMVPLFETTYEVKKPIYTTETYISTEPQEKIETYIEQEPYEVLEQDSRTIVDEKEQLDLVTIFILKDI